MPVSPTLSFGQFTSCVRPDPRRVQTGCLCRHCERVHGELPQGPQQACKAVFLVVARQSAADLATCRQAAPTLAELELRWTGRHRLRSLALAWMMAKTDTDTDAIIGPLHSIGVRKVRPARVTHWANHVAMDSARTKERNTTRTYCASATFTSMHKESSRLHITMQRGPNTVRLRDAEALPAATVTVPRSLTKRKTTRHITSRCQHREVSRYL